MSRPDFWDDMANANKVSKRLSPLKKVIEDFKILETTWEDSNAAYELSEEDPAYEKECVAMLEELGKELDHLEIEVLFSDPYDDSNAIISLHPRRPAATESPGPGLKCCFGCICAGVNDRAIRWKRWIICPGTRLGSKA